VGEGFMVIVKLLGVPEQLLETGVTTRFAVIGILLPLVRVKLVILPTPLVANPMDGVVFIQLYCVPDTTPENINDAAIPLQ
jgi:hypothetical protein